MIVKLGNEKFGPGEGITDKLAKKSAARIVINILQERGELQQVLGQVRSAMMVNIMF